MGTQQSSGGEERAKASAHSRRSHPARGHPVHVCLWRPRRRGRHHRREHQQGRQDRRRRTAVGGPVCSGSGHPKLRRPGHQTGQRVAKTVPGWTLELAAEDDEAKPDVGKNAATKLAGEDEVVGVVGALNSSVSQSLQPVFAAANIVQISPANTGPSLTMGAGYGQPQAGLPDVLPDLHHRHRPGRFCGELPAEHGRDQEGRHHPRQEDLRSGSGGRLHRRSTRARRRDRGSRDHQPGRQGLRVRHHQGQGCQPGSRLLRR